MTDQLLADLRAMTLIRRFEERAVELKRGGEIHGTVHPYNGQEAVAVGVCSSLRQTDRIASTHRGHGHLIAKGADPKRMMAELLGRDTGYCRGRGGSMHIADLELGVLGANGIVAAGIPMVLGSAFASVHLDQSVVSVGFFGDGAVGQGVLWESLILSSNWNLPCVWVCENNRYAVTTPLRDRLPTETVSALVSPALMPVARVDGNDVEAVRAAAETAVRRARDGRGPTFIEADTYRQTWHSYKLAHLPEFRSSDEVHDGMKSDPLPRAAALLRERGVSQTAIDAIALDVETQLEEAVEFARDSPFPDPNNLADYVFAGV